MILKNSPKHILSLWKTSKLYRNGFILLILLSLSIDGHSQLVFNGMVNTEDNASGNIDADLDGIFTDGTWNLDSDYDPTISTDDQEILFPPRGGIGFNYNVTTVFNWSLDAEFTVIIPDPDIHYLVTFFGSNGMPISFANNIDEYMISWTGATGNAVVNDPDGQLRIVEESDSSIRVEQLRNATGDCRRSTGVWDHSCVTWSVSAPEGANTIQVTGVDDASRLEGFGFGVISLSDLSVNKEVAATLLEEGDTSTYTITVENTTDDWAATGVEIIDVLPTGLTFLNSVTSSDGTNSGGTYNPINGEWSIPKISGGEIATLTITFRVDEGTAGQTITNTIEANNINMAQEDIDSDNNGVLIAALNVLSFDRSDAPATYGDVQHEIENGLFIGPTAPDHDALSLAGADADGDDSDGTDDEGGLTTLNFVQGIETLVDIPVEENVAGNGNLSLWLDLNLNGVFDAGEQLATDVNDGGPNDGDGNIDGNIRLSLTIPCTATLGNTFARLRWTTDTAIDATTNATDGEVEDYQVTILCDNEAPTWTTLAGALNITIECDDTSGLTTAQSQFPVASDNCDTDVTNIVKTSGAFVVGVCPNSGTYTNTWTVTDDCGNISEVYTQIITIQDTTEPTWTMAKGALDVTIECDDTEGLNAAQSQFPVASFDCDADVTNIVKTSGAFVVGTCPNSGTYTNTWTVTDDCGNISEVYTQIITIQDTTSPTWTTAVNALDITLECDDSEGLNAAQSQFPVASDNCDADVTNIVKTSGAFVVGACPNSGTYTNTWTVTDDCGNVSEVFTQIITIQDTTSPTWTTAVNALDITLECDDIVGLNTAQSQFPVASDNCDTDVTNIVKTSGAFVTGSCPNEGTYTNMWTVTDDCGNISEVFTQVITIQDTTSPTWINAPMDMTIECDGTIDPDGMFETWLNSFTGTDNCGTAMVTHNSMGLSDNCGATGSETVIFTLTDECGNVSMTDATFTIEDTTPPEFVGTLPTDLFVECDQVPDAATLQAIDICGNTEVYFDEYEDVGSCSALTILTRRWTAIDDCGNETIHEQRISYSCEVEIFNGFTPNNDGINDFFRLEGIDCYPNNTLSIYNRWGVLVFETSGYDNISNVFRGESDDRITITADSKLPTGTYYYVLQYEFVLGDGSNSRIINKAGYVYIQQ
ncbi:T9SS type B sorting domain-containing protein [Winogradskyella tangerina]|uniref:T9SS type B sorting domain-containing protein n=1 Tax=Winogradskyella tangerina TaxID=2023240 RepID=UPI000DBE3230|nr:gliding motility-associated C-terminal domain-containing protein [Winogradskyella tangerina]